MQRDGDLGAALDDGCWSEGSSGGGGWDIGLPMLPPDGGDDDAHESPLRHFALGVVGSSSSSVVTDLL